MKFYQKIRERLTLPENFDVILLGKDDNHLMSSSVVKYVQSLHFERFSGTYQFECYLDQLSVNIKACLISTLESAKINKLSGNVWHPRNLNCTKIGNGSKFHDILREFQNNYHFSEDLSKMSKNYVYGDTEKLYFTSEKIHVLLKTEYDKNRMFMCTRIALHTNVSNFSYV